MLLLTEYGYPDMKNRKITIEFEPTFENVDIIRSAISAICLQAFSAPELKPPSIDFTLAVTEAMNNAVEHSGTERVVIELTVTASAMIFKMTTTGVKFDPTTPATFPDLSSTEDMPEGGFGRAIMRELVDRATYEYQNGCNILTLEKKFSDSEKGEEGGI